MTTASLTRVQRVARTQCRQSGSQGSTGFPFTVYEYNRRRSASKQHSCAPCCTGPEGSCTTRGGGGERNGKERIGKGKRNSVSPSGIGGSVDWERCARGAGGHEIGGGEAHVVGTPRAPWFWERERGQPGVSPLAIATGPCSTLVPRGGCVWSGPPPV